MEVDGIVIVLDHGRVLRPRLFLSALTLRVCLGLPFRLIPVARSAVAFIVQGLQDDTKRLLQESLRAAQVMVPATRVLK